MSGKLVQSRNPTTRIRNSSTSSSVTKKSSRPMGPKTSTYSSFVTISQQIQMLINCNSKHIATYILAFWLRWHKCFALFWSLFLSVKIVRTQEMVRWGMWKHVKWDLGGWAGGLAAGRHLGNFHCLAKPTCAPFKISLHCVRLCFLSVISLVSWPLYSLFKITVFTVQSVRVLCVFSCCFNLCELSKKSKSSK